MPHPIRPARSSNVIHACTALACLVFLLSCSRKSGEGADQPIEVPEEIVAGRDGARVDSLVRMWQEKGFAGSVLLARRGEVLLHRGYGRLRPDRETPVPSSIAFCVASLTKQFTAAAVLHAAQSGALSLDDSLGEMLADAPADKRAITIRELLLHTSGLPPAYAADGIADRDRAIAALLATPLANPPGRSFHYSNDNYNLLAALVEASVDMSYESYLDRWLFEPAGMASATHWGSESLDDETRFAPVLYRLAPGTQEANWGFRGATGLFVSTGDLYRWYLSLRDGRILAPAWVDSMTAPRRDLGGRTVGYGWFGSSSATGRAALWMRGNEGFGHNAILFTIPEEEIVVIVATHVGAYLGEPYARILAREIEMLLLAAA